MEGGGTVNINIDKIKIERAKRNLTLEELSKKAGIGTSTLYKIESRKTCPRLGTVDKIAIALDKKVEDFLITCKGMDE